jgi:hypothetical protein
MRHACSVPVLIALAALAGYASGARPVQAQPEPWPFSIGEVVTFEFADNGSRQCRIEEVKGGFALCRYPSDQQGFTIGRREPPEEWVNLAVVEWVTKPAVRSR